MYEHARTPFRIRRDDGDGRPTKRRTRHRATRVAWVRVRRDENAAATVAARRYSLCGRRDAQDHVMYATRRRSISGTPCDGVSLGLFAYTVSSRPGISRRGLIATRARFYPDEKRSCQTTEILRRRLCLIRARVPFRSYRVVNGSKRLPSLLSKRVGVKTSRGRPHVVSTRDPPRVSRNVGVRTRKIV